MKRAAYSLAVLLLLATLASGGPQVNVSQPSPVNLSQVGGTAAVTGGVAGTLGVGGTTAAGSAFAGNPEQIAGVASGNVTRAVFCDQNAAVSISTAATTKIIALVAGKTTRICSWDLFSAGTDNVALVYGTGTNCGTGTTAIIGGATAATGYNFTAQTGIAKSLPTGTVIAEASANDTCIITSAAVQLSGSIQYTQF